MSSTIMFTTSNILKSTLLNRSNAILRYSHGHVGRNLSTKQATEKAVKGVRGTLSKLAGYQKPIVYNAKVLKEIAKEVYTKESLGPPNGAQISEAWESLKSIRLKDLGPQDFARIGIHSIEAAGFFALGEMIGRFSIVGYNV